MVTVYIQEYKNNSWQYNAISLDTEEDFSIHQEDLHGELCKIGQLIAKYGEIQAKLKAQLARMEARVEQTEAELAQTLRTTPPAGFKVTENSVDEMVKTDPSYQQVLSQRIQTQQDSMMADNLFKGMMKKADALNALTYYSKEEYRRAGM